MTVDEAELETSTKVNPWAKVPVWVMDYDLSGGEFKIYVALRSFCNTRSECWPTARAVAERAGRCSVSAVRNAVQKFRKLGLLESEKVYRPGKKELAHLRYHFVDIDPRKSETTVPLPQLSEGCTSTEVGVSLSQVTQEETIEETKEQTKKSSSSASSSSSARTSASNADEEEDARETSKNITRPRCSTKIPTQRKPRVLTEDQRADKIAARKQRERTAAIKSICERLGSDEELAGLLCDYLTEQHTVGNLARYVDGIADDELGNHHELATWEFAGQRTEWRSTADHYTEQLRKRHQKAPAAEMNKVWQAIYDSAAGGVDQSTIKDRLNARIQPPAASWVAGGYLDALTAPVAVEAA